MFVPIFYLFSSLLSSLFIELSNQRSKTIILGWYIDVSILYPTICTICFMNPLCPPIPLDIRRPDAQTPQLIRQSHAHTPSCFGNVLPRLHLDWYLLVLQPRLLRGGQTALKLTNLLTYVSEHLYWLISKKTTTGGEGRNRDQVHLTLAASDV